MRDCLAENELIKNFDKSLINTADLSVRLNYASNGMKKFNVDI